MLRACEHILLSDSLERTLGLDVMLFDALKLNPEDDDDDDEEDDDVLESDDDGSSGESFCSVCRVVESSRIDNVSIL